MCVCAVLCMRVVRAHTPMPLCVSQEMQFERKYPREENGLETGEGLTATFTIHGKKGIYSLREKKNKYF